MTKILAFGDLHLHPWQEGDRSNRLQQCVVCVHRILVAAADERVDAAVFLGDLFEAKRSIRAEVLVAAGNLFQYAARILGSIPLYMIVGNHDYLGPSSPSVLSAFSSYGTVIECTVWSQRVGDTQLLFIPHGCQDPVLQDPTLSYDVAFSHGADVWGPAPNMYYTPGAKLDGPTEYALRVSGIRRGCLVCGHHHMPQSLNVERYVPVVCVGAPMSHDWSDMEPVDDNGDVIGGYVRGACIVSVENHVVKISRIVRGNAFPRFFDRRPKCFREDFDFVREIPTDVNAADTHVHENVEEIAGGDVLAAVRGFAQERAPRDSVREYTSVGEQLVGVESSIVIEEDAEEEL